MSSEPSPAARDRRHTLRIALLTAIATLIALPLVIWVLGPNMPPGKGTDVANSQVFDNTVLLVVMTPFTMFILVYLAYTLTVFRAGDGELLEGAPIRGHIRLQIAWLAATTIAVLFLAIFGTAELFANGSGGGQGPSPITKPGGALPVQVIAQQWEFTYRYPTYGGVETAQLEIPVDRQIAFHVTSLDAIHSFWAYQLGVKADANPSVDNVAYAKARKTGNVRHSLCRAVRPLARLHVRHRPGRDERAVRILDHAAAKSVPRGDEGAAAVLDDLQPRPDRARRMKLRRLIGFNLLTGIVLGIVGFYAGRWLGRQVTGKSLDYFGDTNQNDIALFVGYFVGVVGFLVGLGFANYPLQRLLGKPPSIREKETGGVGRYFGLCTDHKVVGIQYLAGIGAFIFIGGLNAMLIRVELLTPNEHAWNANNYLTLVGLHGTMMMGMMTSGILGPFANYFVPILIGARRMAFPRIEALTFWLLMAGGVILVTAFAFGGFPTGWTGYEPLADQANLGMDAYIAFFALVGLSMALLGLNMLVTILTMRAPGMTWSRLPIFVWATLRPPS